MPLYKKIAYTGEGLLFGVAEKGLGMIESAIRYPELTIGSLGLFAVAGKAAETFLPSIVSKVLPGKATSFITSNLGNIGTFSLVAAPAVYSFVTTEGGLSEKISESIESAGSMTLLLGAAKYGSKAVSKGSELYGEYKAAKLPDLLKIEASVSEKTGAFGVAEQGTGIKVIQAQPRVQANVYNPITKQTSLYTKQFDVLSTISQTPEAGIVSKGKFTSTLSEINLPPASKGLMKLEPIYTRAGKGELFGQYYPKKGGFSGDTVINDVLYSSKNPLLLTTRIAGKATGKPYVEPRLSTLTQSVIRSRTGVKEWKVLDLGKAETEFFTVKKTLKGFEQESLSAAKSLYTRKGTNIEVEGLLEERRPITIETKSYKRTEGDNWRRMKRVIDIEPLSKQLATPKQLTGPRIGLFQRLRPSSQRAETLDIGLRKGFRIEEISTPKKKFTEIKDNIISEISKPKIKFVEISHAAGRVQKMPELISKNVLRLHEKVIKARVNKLTSSDELSPYGRYYKGNEWTGSEVTSRQIARKNKPFDFSMFKEKTNLIKTPAVNKIKFKIQLAKAKSEKTIIQLGKKEFLATALKKPWIKGNLGYYDPNTRRIWYEPKGIKRQGKYNNKKNVLLHELGHKLDIEKYLKISKKGLPIKEKKHLENLENYFKELNYPKSQRYKEIKAELISKILQGEKAKKLPALKEKIVKKLREIKLNYKPKFKKIPIQREILLNVEVEVPKFEKAIEHKPYSKENPTTQPQKGGLISVLEKPKLKKKLREELDMGGLARQDIMTFAEESARSDIISLEQAKTRQHYALKISTPQLLFMQPELKSELLLKHKQPQILNLYSEVSSKLKNELLTRQVSRAKAISMTKQELRTEQQLERIQQPILEIQEETIKITPPNHPFITTPPPERPPIVPPSLIPLWWPEGSNAGAGGGSYFEGSGIPRLKGARPDVKPLSDLLSINITEIGLRGGKATHPAQTTREKVLFDIGFKSGQVIFPTMEMRKSKRKRGILALL